MRFIHISDLHLGKRVGEFSMLEDQKHILKNIIEIVKESDPCGIFVAGDIYDKSQPTAEAVALWDDFITQIAALNIHIFIISGNHDCPERVAYGERLMENVNIHIAPVFDGHLKCIPLKTSDEEINIFLMPFIKPAAVRRFYENMEINDYNDAVRTVLEGTAPDTKKVNILLAHQFVTGAQRCDSEELSVGGLDNIDAALFDDFDYVALGHIHSPQKISRDTIRYSGSPLKYSLSEEKHKKSVTLIETQGKDIKISALELHPLRDLRSIKGNYDDITLRKNYINTNTEDYVYITLTNEDDIPDAIGKLRSIYPNIMRVDYDNLRTKNSKTLTAIKNPEDKSPLQLFSEFYENQNNKSMSIEQEMLITKLIEEIGL